jgi:2,3-bisphosphoglycerate-independent phosphoglycerate mutase
MKYAIVLPDGAADEPLPQLSGRTPLEVASIPEMDWVARSGVQGRVVTVPPGFTPGTDVATLTLFGYDPDLCYTGRAPLEAVARGLAVRADQIVFRCNFVTIADGRMNDFTAGHIAQPDADALIDALNGALADEGCTFHSGVSYRNLMLASDALAMDLRCAPPHDIPDKPVAEHWPRGAGVERVMRIMDRAAVVLAEHPVNQRRRREGHDPATNIWLWGQGRPTKLESFQSRFGIAGAVITGVDIIRGIALAMGMELILVPGATGYLDTDYRAKGEAAVRALERHDLVVVHVEAADEAGHLGDAGEKVRALERIDAEIVGPLLEALRRSGPFRILVAPDHPTPVSTKSHSADPPPFCYAGSGIPAESGRPFSEASAGEGGLLLEKGTGLIERFIR